MKVNYERLGGRRFLLTVGTLLLSTVLLWFARISDAVWRDVLIATVAVYVTGNTAQKAIERKREEPGGGE